ncbi:MAG TPA: hypothetical protein VJL61_03180, partial [Rhodanobacteraceae bacterium]|nr:hypothetical protein [Rhodanobacteraceae bacterium]
MTGDLHGLHRCAIDSPARRRRVRTSTGNRWHVGTNRTGHRREKGNEKHNACVMLHVIPQVRHGHADTEVARR